MEHPITIIDKIRSYQADAAAVCKLVHPELEAAIAESRQKRQPVQHVIRCRFAEKEFVCLLDARALTGQIVVFKMLPAEKYFEAVAYHPGDRLYYYFEWHFFERYAQRLKVKRWRHVDILRHYVLHNPLMVSEFPKNDSKLRHHLLAMTNTGLIHAMKEATNVIICTTLINRFHLTKQQMQDTCKLRTKFFNERSKRMPPPMQA